MDIKDIQHLAVERIYLVPDASEGQLCYLWCVDPAPSQGMDASEAVEYVRKDVHEAIIKRQANASKTGMDAAKKHGSHMESEAKRLHAECNPEALESEREANAKLTELVAELERERDAYRTAEEHQIALRQKIEQERDALAALFVRLQDGATDLIHASSEEEAGDAMELIAECSEKEARNILDRRDAEQRALEIEALSLKMNKDWEGNDCLWPETLTARYNELRKQVEAKQ